MKVAAAPDVPLRPQTQRKRSAIHTRAWTLEPSEGQAVCTKLPSTIHPQHRKRLAALNAEVTRQAMTIIAYADDD